MRRDDLGDRLRAAKPGRTRRTAPLSARALSELVELQPAAAGEDRQVAARRAGRKRHYLGLTSMATTVAVLAAVVLVWANTRSTPAAAVTPPLLEVRAVHGTAKEMLLAASARRLAHRGAGVDGSTSTGVIRSQQWALDTSIAADGSITSSVVEPETRVMTFRADGSVELVARAAKPFRGEPAKGLPVLGSVVDRETFHVNDHDNPYRRSPPTDAAAIGGYLARSGGIRNPTAGDYLQVVEDLVSNRLLQAGQEAAILRFLARQPGITLAGRVTDRLGRAGIAYVASDRRLAEYRDMLIVSPETGKIIAAETIYIGHDRTDIPSPATVYYVAWRR